MPGIPVDPVQEAAAVRRKLAVMHRLRVWLRRLRLVLAAALVIVLVYGWLSYSFYAVPGTPAKGAQTAGFPVHGVQRGDTLLLQKLNFGRSPRPGDIVIYRNPSAVDGAPESLIGRVAGLPGEVVHGHGPTISVGEREPLGIGFDPGPETRVRAGDTIPAYCYLVVVDIDSVPYTDSRTLGYIASQHIQTRVALNLTQAFGRP